MEEELEKELRFHLDRHTADLIARGLDPEEARRRARLALSKSLLQIVEHIDKNGVYHEPEPENPASWLEEYLWPQLGGEDPPF